MKFTISDFFLEFKTPFSIAHGTRIGTDIVFVEIEHEGISAIGEASLPPYLDESPETVRSFIHSFLSEEFDLFNDLSASLEFLLNYKSKNYAAKACIDIALHNWFAAKNKVAVYELLGLKATSNPICTFTIGMDNEKNLEQKTCEKNGCFGVNEYADSLHIVNQTLLEGGPFTGLAMPVGIASTFVDLSHNSLTEISESSLLGITATTLYLP